MFDLQPVKMIENITIEHINMQALSVLTFPFGRVLNKAVFIVRPVFDCNISGVREKSEGMEKLKGA